MFDFDSLNLMHVGFRGWTTGLEDSSAGGAADSFPPVPGCVVGVLCRASAGHGQAPAVGNHQLGFCFLGVDLVAR